MRRDTLGEIKWPPDFSRSKVQTPTPVLSLPDWKRQLHALSSSFLKIDCEICVQGVYWEVLWEQRLSGRESSRIMQREELNRSAGTVVGPALELEWPFRIALPAHELFICMPCLNRSLVAGHTRQKVPSWSEQLSFSQGQFLELWAFGSQHFWQLGEWGPWS